LLLERFWNIVTPEHRKQWACALMFITPALWAVNYLVGRSAVETVAPHLLALGRWSLAAVLLLCFSWREVFEKRAAIKTEWKHFLALGALGMWICGAWVYLGARTTPATNISLIYSVSPVLIALVSTFYLKERMGRVQGCGVALALAGVLHVIFKGQWSGLANVEFTAGDLWILGAAMSWTVYSLLLRAWPSAFGPMARLTLVVCASIPVLIPFTIVEAVWFIAPQMTWKAFGYMLAAAVFPGFGAYLAYSYMQRELGAARVGVVLYLGPVYAAVTGYLVLSEPIHTFHWVGAALILPGIYLATRPVRKRSA
jgi:drug/metabolite transporter (DMT)-like permease